MQHENSMLHTLSDKTIRDICFTFGRIKDYIASKDLFEKQKGNYYSLFDKCVTTMIDCLISSCLTEAEKKKFLATFFKATYEYLDLYELINTIDIGRIKAFYCL